MNDDNVKKRLCRSLAQRVTKGEHENDQFKQDLDAFILNENAQLAAGKAIRRGKNRRSIEPLLKARRLEGLPEEQRELGRFVSGEMGQVNEVKQKQFEQALETPVNTTVSCAAAFHLRRFMAFLSWREWVGCAVASKACAGASHAHVKDVFVIERLVARRLSWLHMQGLCLPRSLSILSAALDAFRSTLWLPPAPQQDNPDLVADVLLFLGIAIAPIPEHRELRKRLRARWPRALFDRKCCAMLAGSSAAELSSSSPSRWPASSLSPLV